MSWLNLSFPRPIDQKLFQTMKKLTEGTSAKDVFRGAETLFAQGADPNAVGTDVDTGSPSICLPAFCMDRAIGSIVQWSDLQSFLSRPDSIHKSTTEETEHKRWLMRVI